LLPAAPALARVKTVARFEGNYGAELTAIPVSARTTTVRGSLLLSRIPATARIEKATLYCNQWFTTAPTSATIDGTSLPVAYTFDTDGPHMLSAYRWDVTPYVSGNGSYQVTIGPVHATYGVALAVIFSDPSLPPATVVMNEGATSVGENQKSGSYSTDF